MPSGSIEFLKSDVRGASSLFLRHDARVTEGFRTLLWAGEAPYPSSHLSVALHALIRIHA